LSAPDGARTHSLRSTLANFNVEVIDAADFVPRGKSLLASITAAIEKSDFLCIYLPSRGDNRVSMLEAGLALGHGKRVLIVADSYSTPLVGFPQMVWLNRDSANLTSLEAGIRAFLEHFDDVPVPEGMTSLQAAPLDFDFKLARELLATPYHLTPHEAENIVARLLEATGASVREPEEKDAGADLVAWLSETIPRVGNPLLVEVKTGTFTKRSFSQFVESLRSYLRRANLPTGLLVYWNSLQDGALIPPRGRPLVIAMSLRELLDEAEKGSLGYALARRAKVIAADQD
jgi:hypothetical protein